MSHSHWDAKRFPEANRLSRHEMLKAECDALWTAYLHGHEGTPCDKRVEEGAKVALCVMRPNAALKKREAGGR